MATKQQSDVGSDLDHPQYPATPYASGFEKSPGLNPGGRGLILPYSVTERLHRHSLYVIVRVDDSNRRWNMNDTTLIAAADMAALAANVDLRFGLDEFAVWLRRKKTGLTQQVLCSALARAKKLGWLVEVETFTDQGEQTWGGGREIDTVLRYRWSLWESGVAGRALYRDAFIMAEASRDYQRALHAAGMAGVFFQEG